MDGEKLDFTEALSLYKVLIKISAGFTLVEAHGHDCCGVKLSVMNVAIYSNNKQRQ